MWGTATADYEMDPDIVNNPAYTARMTESLRSIPTNTIVTDEANLFDATTGIYANPLSEGVLWERPVSVEWINPDGTTAFQIEPPPEGTTDGAAEMPELAVVTTAEIGQPVWFASR